MISDEACACRSFAVPMFSAISTDASNGALTLAELRAPKLTVVCAPCNRRGSYDVQRLVAQRGDAKLTDLLVTLADCQKARSASIHDRCKAVFEGLAA